MSLEKYRKMRDFSKTREPAGKLRARAGHSYVVQKHAASHLHYDFRLELGGVLLSWAVPKGPSLDPSVKRLAVQTEDHPIEYGGFEGTIPSGAYGAGTVMLWDRGSFEPEGDAQQAYEKGHLTFVLHGEKLRGRWHLVRTRRGGEKQKTWLLFKAQDEAARPGVGELSEAEDVSVLTGRRMDAIARGEAKPKRAAKPQREAKPTAAEAKPKREAKPKTAQGKPKRGDAKPERAEVKPRVRAARAAKKAAGAPRRSSKKSASAAARGDIPGARRAPIPSEVEPELATLVSETPTGQDFIHEVKFDGYRVLARIDAGRVTLFTRNGEDWTERMPTLAEALPRLPVESAILDGEFVALDEKGASDFQLLQNSFSGKSSAPLVYYAFDLLYLDGYDLKAVSLLDRKAQLKALFDQLPSGSTLRYSDHRQGGGAEFFAAAVKLGLEGVVSKRANSSYRPGRGKDWQKSKSNARQEFVIVGFTDPGGGRAHLGALLLGVHRDRKIVYSGRVGTGFNERSLRDLHARLQPLEISKPQLENAPRGADVRGVHWVTPKLVAEVAYTGITHDGLLRHPTFKGLREDKPAEAVVQERPVRAVSGRAAPKAAAKAASTPPLSNPDKVLYPELGLTKRELAEYYDVVSELMLPQVVQRPLTLLRCPEGRSKQCFFQKHPGESLAPGLARVQVPSSDGESEYAAVADERGLSALVQMGVLEAHIWGAKMPDPEHPDQLVFDLDPDPELGFKDVIRAAHDARALLEELGLKSWIKTTGGKGLHVTVPIVPRADWDEAKDFCRAVAEELTRRHPERYLATMSKAKRRGKIFIDYLRNGRGATFIAPYSPRAREGAGIAMPIEWDDLNARFKPQSFTVRSAAKYLAKRRVDPFRSLLEARQKLPSLKGAAGKRA